MIAKRTFVATCGQHHGHWAWMNTVRTQNGWTGLDGHVGISNIKIFWRNWARFKLQPAKPAQLDADPLNFGDTGL